MRKFISFMLLASAAAASAPALAAPSDRADREQARAERQQAREDRQDRQDREDNRSARREQASQPPAAAPAFERRQPQAAPPMFERRQPQAAATMVEPRQRVDPPARAERPDFQAIRDARSNAPDSVRDWRSEQRRQALLPPAQRRGDRVLRDRLEQRREEARARIAERGHVRPPVISTTPRPGAQPPPPVARRPTPAVRWSSNWRHDNRYDWYNWRRHHHSLFNLGFYFDPFGWGYQRYNIGWRMWPNFYGRQYWLNDPWQYRLPYAPPGYRWVRYWDDAVLVDTWSGQVEDVIYSFFW